MGPAPLISVVIVNHRSWRPLSRALNSLAASSLELQIIVVDNASGDGRLQEFRDRYAQVRFVQSDVNGGFAAGCNLGATYATAPDLLFLNPDTAVGHDALRSLLEHHRRHGPGISAPPQVGDDGAGRRVSGMFPQASTAFGWSRALRRLWRRETQLDGECPRVDWVTGAALLIDGKSFRRLGGFDDGYWMYYEDVDLCRRAHDLDISVRECQVPPIVHEHGGATRRDAATATVTRTEVVVSRHRYISRHLRGLESIFLHATTLIGRGVLPLPLAAVSATRRARSLALMRYYRRALKTRSWKPQPGRPEAEAETTPL